MLWDEWKAGYEAKEQVVSEARHRFEEAEQHLEAIRSELDEALRDMMTHHNAEPDRDEDQARPEDETQ